jgi:hypothetical protein
VTFAVSVAVPDQPARVDLTISQGATFRAEFTWLVDGVARSLDGCSALMAIARRPGADVLAQVSSSDGEITFDPERRGVLMVTISAAKTSELRVTKPASYDLLVIDGDDVFRIAEGSVVVRRAVTLPGA